MEELLVAFKKIRLRLILLFVACILMLFLTVHLFTQTTTFIEKQRIEYAIFTAIAGLLNTYYVFKFMPRVIHDIRIARYTIKRLKADIIKLKQGEK